MLRVFVSLAFVLLCSTSAWGQSFGDKSVEEIIKTMSIEQKAGQLFILGFTGSDYNQALKKQIDHLQPGAIIVFGRNIKTLNQIRTLNQTAQDESMKKNGIPLLISVDQEGGNVLRIKTNPSLPSARTLALTDNDGLVQDAGFVTGQLMTSLGFNMNLAPVVDISNSDFTDFLGSRSFSHQKEVVNRMSVAFSKGLIDAGILPTAKHFPGHGGVSVDSHLATPYKQVSLTELLFNDLSPYKEMQKNRIPFAIMASHISYPLIDPSRKPASFSPLLLENILRRGLGFEGILLTDDIQMEGAKGVDGTIGSRAVEAILAGNDLIMVGWNYQVQKRALSAVIKAIKSGKISEQRLNASLKRLLNYKMQFYKKKSALDLKTQLAQIPLTKTFDRIFHEVLKNQVQDMDISKKKVNVLSYSWRFLTTYKEQQMSRLHHLQNFKSWEDYSNSDIIIYHLTGPTTAKILRSAPLSMKDKIVVINSSSQTHLKQQNLYAKVLNIHAHHPRLGAMTALHLNRPKTKAERQLSGDSIPESELN
jgi:beta-N-acetylhexosaminidase